MSTEIQQFDFKGASLRTLTDKAGEPWFVAKDVCDVLGYTNASKAISDHVDSEDKLNNESLSSLGQRGGWLVNESGLYSLVLSSKLPTAKEFKRWVTHEVLPQIRKHGAYMTQQTLDKALTSPDFLIQLATKLKEEQEKVKELEPKAKALDDFTNVEGAKLIRDAAKILSNAGTPIGEKRLREWMADNGWIYRHNGCWHANQSHVNAHHLREVESQKHGTHKDGTSFAFPPTVRITRKGLALLHKRLGEITLDKALEADADHE
mgnify:CR=1 FL=1